MEQTSYFEIFESIVNFFLRIDVVYTMKGLGDKIEDSTIIEKMLISLTPSFNAKVSAIEEMQDLKQLAIEILLRILMAYAMRIKGDQCEVRSFLQSHKRRKTKART